MSSGVSVEGHGGHQENEAVASEERVEEKVMEANRWRAGQSWGNEYKGKTLSWEEERGPKKDTCEEGDIQESPISGKLSAPPGQ